MGSSAAGLVAAGTETVAAAVAASVDHLRCAGFAREERVVPLLEMEVHRRQKHLWWSLIGFLAEGEHRVWEGEGGGRFECQA